MNRVGQVCVGRSTAAQETDPFLMGESGVKAGAGTAGQCQMPGGLQGCRHTHRLHWALRTPAVTRGRQVSSCPVCGGAGGGAGREQALWRGERGHPVPERRGGEGPCQSLGIKGCSVACSMEEARLSQLWAIRKCSGPLLARREAGLGVRPGRHWWPSPPWLPHACFTAAPRDAELTRPVVRIVTPASDENTAGLAEASGLVPSISWRLQRRFFTAAPHSTCRYHLSRPTPPFWVRLPCFSLVSPWLEVHASAPSPQ